jgi:MFS family permease
LTHEDPLIDVRLLGNRQIVLGNTLALLIGLGSFQMPFLLNLLLQQPVWTGVGLGVSAALAGVLKLPSNISSAIAAGVSGHLAGQRGARFAALIGAVIAIVSWTGLTLWHDNLWTVVLGMVCANVGNAIILAAAPILVLGAVPVERSSEATGLTSVSRAIGTAAGAQAIALLLATSTVSGPAGQAVFPDNHAYVLALGYIALTAAASLGCALLIPRRAQFKTVVPVPDEPKPLS